MSSPTTPAEPTLSQRILAIDVLRGFDMMCILGLDGVFRAIQKAQPGGVTGFLGDQMEHVEWEGFRFYDLIFPLFVFLMGMSMVFSLDKRMAQDSRISIFRHILFRSLALFALGMIYYGGMEKLLKMDILWGVLNRMGVCYLAAGFLYVLCGTRIMAALSVIILAGYWLLFSFVPVPGSGGITGTGQEANWGLYIDLKLPPYYGFSSEGCISHLPAIVTCILGVLAGKFLKDSTRSPGQKVMAFMGAGVVMVAAGYAWGLHFPIVKQLWTSSYVMVAGGYSCLLFGLFYWVTDVLKFQAWTPAFIWVGMNPVALYMTDNFINYKRAATSLVGGPIAEIFGAYGVVLLACTQFAVFLMLARLLYKNKIFLRV